ncbi:FOG: transposase and inactivated derivative, partial [Paenibacillus popilliae ATCC 14706]
GELLEGKPHEQFLWGGAGNGPTAPRQSFTRQVFFRWIKQHVNVPTLFGTTENAVYGQLFGALITYVLLKWLYDVTNTGLPRHAVLSFARFARLVVFCSLSVEWQLRIHCILLGESRLF